MIAPLMGMSQNNDILATPAEKIAKVSYCSLQQAVRITRAKLFIREKKVQRNIVIGYKGTSDSATVH